MKTGEQIAALSVRWDKSGKPRVLMVTSRDTGRWVMPKGWCMKGISNWEAAKIEALEEAGAVGVMVDEPIGEYQYVKRLDDGAKVLARVTVYPMFVESLKRNWKERKERKRRWFSFRKAAKLVDEPELSDLLNKLAKNTDTLRKVRDLRKAS